MPESARPAESTSKAGQGSGRAVIMASTTGEPDARASSGNPFPGPQPYVGAQRDVFFGRADAVSTLLSLILSSHIVLLHAPSGAGKSSLLQAGLLPALDDARIPMVATVRFAQERESDLVTGTESKSRGPDEDSFVDRTIGRLVAGRKLDVAVPHTIAEAVQTLRIPDGQVFVMLLDQFEELFADPAQWQARKEFLRQLSAAVEAEPRLRVILGMRSDYLAALIPYERDLPSRLVIRMSLPGLSDRAVEQVIRKAFLRSGVAISERALGELVESLFRTGGKEVPETTRAEFANLIQLQIVCRRAWDRLRDRRATDGQVMEDVDLDVAGTMVSFVDAAVHSVATRASIDEAWIRCWLESLILPGNRRAIVSVEGLGDTVHEILDELEEARLLRLEYRNQSRLAELTHDSMVAALIESNRRWRRRARRARLRRSVLALAVVVIMLTSFVVVFVKAQDSSVTYHDGALETGPFDVAFAGSPKYPVAVVELQLAPQAAGGAPITVSISERRPNTGAWTEIASRTYSSGELEDTFSPYVYYRSLSGIVTVTAADLEYRVRTTSTYSGYEVGISVSRLGRVESLDIGGTAGSTSLEFNAATGSQRAVQLPAGSYRIQGVQSVAAPRVIDMDEEDFVVVLGRGGIIALTSSAYGAARPARITSLASADPLSPPGTQTTAGGELSLARIDLSWDTLPTSVSIRCDAVISYSVRNLAEPTDVVISSPSSSVSHRALLASPGNHVLVLTGSGRPPSTCRVDVAQSRDPVEDVGVSELTLGGGPLSTEDALAFRMSQTRLLLAPHSEGIRYGYSCADGSGSDGRLARTGTFAAVLPADVYCVLSARRSPGTTAVRIPITTTALPGSASTGRPR